MVSADTKGIHDVADELMIEKPLHEKDQSEQVSNEGPVGMTESECPILGGFEDQQVGMFISKNDLYERLGGDESKLPKDLIMEINARIIASLDNKNRLKTNIRSEMFEHLLQE